MHANAKRDWRERSGAFTPAKLPPYRVSRQDCAGFRRKDRRWNEYGGEAIGGDCLPFMDFRATEYPEVMHKALSGGAMSHVRAIGSMNLTATWMHAHETALTEIA